MKATELDGQDLATVLAALRYSMGVLIACVVPAGGCDDAAALAFAIEQGDAALAAAGRLRSRLA